MNGEFSLPCFKCEKEMWRVETGGYELQPDDGLHFSTTGAYGSTKFDPMDGSSLNIVICDECIVKAGRAGRVMLNQDYVGLAIIHQVDLGGGATMPSVFPCGFYSPEREPVTWDPDKEYERQDPVHVEYEEVAEAKNIHSTTMWKASAVEHVRQFLSAEAEAADDEPNMR